MSFIETINETKNFVSFFLQAEKEFGNETNVKLKIGGAAASVINDITSRFVGAGPLPVFKYGTDDLIINFNSFEHRMVFTDQLTRFIDGKKRAVALACTRLNEFLASLDNLKFQHEMFVSRVPGEEEKTIYGTLHMPPTSEIGEFITADIKNISVVPTNGKLEIVFLPSQIDQVKNDFYLKLSVLSSLFDPNTDYVDMPKTVDFQYNKNFKKELTYEVLSKVSKVFGNTYRSVLLTSEKPSGHNEKYTGDHFELLANYYNDGKEQTVKTLIQFYPSTPKNILDPLLKDLHRRLSIEGSNAEFGPIMHLSYFNIGMSFQERTLEISLVLRKN